MEAFDSRPLQLTDFAAIEMAERIGWQSTWMAKAPSRAAQAKAAEAASGNVVDSLRALPKSGAAPKAMPKALGHPSVPLSAVTPMASPPPVVVTPMASPPPAVVTPKAIPPMPEPQHGLQQIVSPLENGPAESEGGVLVATTGSPPNRFAGSGERVTCVICMDAMGGNEELETLRCNHKLHAECLRSWRERAVPAITNIHQCPMGCHRSSGRDEEDVVPMAIDGWERVDASEE